MHAVEDAPVDRLEAVPHVGQRAGNDHAHGVIEVGALHLLLERHRHDVVAGRTRRISQRKYRKFNALRRVGGDRKTARRKPPDSPVKIANFAYANNRGAPVFRRRNKAESGGRTRRISPGCLCQSSAQLLPALISVMYWMYLL